MTHPNPVFAAALPIAQAWLAGCHFHDEEPFCEDGSFIGWNYRRDALGHGILEFIDDTRLSTSRNLLSLSLDLNLPPIRTAEDAYGVLSVADMLDGAAIVAKDYEEGVLSVQIRMPLEQLTPETLPALYRRLAAAKRYIEEP